MKIKTWNAGMSDKETADLAYWERNMLALKYADGWYNDDIRKPLPEPVDGEPYAGVGRNMDSIVPRFDGWRRVLSLELGSITFHIPDDFDVGPLVEVPRNWDGHTTEEKWLRIANECRLTVTP